MGELYTCKDVAERYGVQIITVWEWIRKKKLGAIKIGKEYRVSAEDIKAFERSRRTNLILKMPHQQVGEVNLVDEMVDRLLDILADKLTERLSAGHKELYTAKELAERYGVSCATIRNKMAAGEFGELVSVGERTRLVPWAGVQAYESTHTGMSTKRTSEKHRAVSHGNPGPI